jgi:dihydroxyacetone kinase
VKRFINDRDTIVSEALDGLAALGELARLDGYPYIKVLTRAQIDPSKVAVVSGGGAGHEPAHAGFVGPGMLSAAVSGEIFASPSVDAVEAGIMSVIGDAGCLLIVKNYTGDRLNFGLAAERVRARGLRVETVLVADDVALPESVQPRGVAGTLFVHKLAGYLAERGEPLDVVAAAARAAAADVRSLGVSLEGCTIPGQAPTARLAANEGELGLGIHGEPGVEKFELASVKSIVALLAARLGASLPDEHARYAALINNLGAVPNIEMSVITHEILRSSLAERIELVIGPAPLMTSLDMNGFSLSLLRLDETRREALCGEPAPPAWPRASVVHPVQVRPLPQLGARVLAEVSSDPAIERVLGKILLALIDAQAQLDELDAKIGDGDTGTTIATAARAIQAELGKLPLASPALLLARIAELLGTVMGGSSGVLLAISCTAASEALARGRSWPAALHEGAMRMSEYGGARVGDRTLLDALLPALEVLIRGDSLRKAAEAARAGADTTATMHAAKAGRAAYLRAGSLVGVCDPGAVAVAIAFEAASG